MQLQTLRIRALSGVDRARLRSMPQHPVHHAALATMHNYAEGRIILARAADDAIRAYLTFHDVDPRTVMLDYLYSPFGGGCGTRLVRRFEGCHVGKKAVLMSTIRAVPFYKRLGYDVDAHFYMLTKQL